MMHLIQTHINPQHVQWITTIRVTAKKDFF